MESSIVRDIVRAANAAPSGHNTAPWRLEFEPRRAALSVHLVPGADTTAFNAGERGSYFAIGALIENACIAARFHRFRPDVRYFPRPSDQTHVADIMFYSDSLSQGRNIKSLYDAIHRRSTNRKPYPRRPLLGDDKTTLAEVRPPDGTSIRLIADLPAISRVANALAVPDRLLFENHHLHGSVFPHIIWRARDNNAGKKGLYIKTLELPLPAQAAFGAFRVWPLARTLGALGFGRAVARGNAANYGAASALALVGVERDSLESFVHAGEALERLWLTAESRGVSAHPLAGLFFLSLGIQNGHNDRFDRRAIRRIEEAEGAIQDTVNLSGTIPLAALRLGYGGAPSARTGRRPIESVFEEIGESSQ